jgi:hypothetical protein
MVKHGALSKSHVYQLLRSKDARVRRAAFTLLETSNPRLRRSSEIFIEIIRFIWDANPSYDVYHEFTKRHFQVLRVTRSNCQAAACRGECNQDEVLVIAYCGARRGAVTLVNERTVICPRGAATSPLVMICAKAGS